jgi:hypothetical protein
MRQYISVTRCPAVPIDTELLFQHVVTVPWVDAAFGGSMVARIAGVLIIGWIPVIGFAQQPARMALVPQEPVRNGA